MGSVAHNGRTATKPSVPVRLEDDIRVVRSGPMWVSRAGEKLDDALELFGADGLRVQGSACLDAGASTGGFTQVLLARGAASVIAVDVGHDQLADQVRADARVREMSRTNIRDVQFVDIGEPVDLLVADLSFISLGVVLPALTRLVTQAGDLVVLVKPQFEVGRAELTGSGLVRTPAARAKALLAVTDEAAAGGLATRAICASPIRGVSGNQEYLVWLRRDQADTMSAADRAAAAEHLATTETSHGPSRHRPR